MKKIVLELLEQRELSYLFNESDFNYYKRKATNGRGFVNQYWLSLAILDMFIINANPIVSA